MPDGGLGDALDVFTHDLSMPLGATLPKTFATFATVAMPRPDIRNEVILNPGHFF
jgi:hypothetical protein